MTDAFGNWLSGFIDGEGCFSVIRVSSRNGNPNHKTWPNCRLRIALRGDDLPILKEIRDELEMGSITVHMRKTGLRPNEQGGMALTIHRIGDCVRLVDLFEKYPLRAKKKQQFAVWADAVREVAKGKDRSDELVNEYRQKLADLRHYVPPEGVQDAIEGNPPVLKHRKQAS